MKRLQLAIGGIHCSFCAQTIERAFRHSPGVNRVSVSLAHEEMLVEYDERKVDEGALKAAVRELGYSIRDADKARAFQQQELELRRRRQQTILAASASAATGSGMLLMWLGFRLPNWGHYLMAALATWVVFWVGRDIDAMALAGLKRRILNQHVLLFFGATGGFAAGILGFFVPAFPRFHFFGAAVFLMTYHLLSGYVAAKVHARSQEAVRKLLALRPDTARRIDDGREVEVPTTQVRVGERIRILPGESVPLDGRVIEGYSAVNEAVVTGEPIPVEKLPGDRVIGGSINLFGTLVVEVTATAEQGFLRQVARYVEEARALKPGILQLVDLVLKYFVPGVLLTAAAAFFFWTVGWRLIAGAPDLIRAVYAALTVLVMGYPCALGMATPLALIRGGGMAAERGVLMRSAEAYQVLREVGVVVLDKTGTITKGKPQVGEVEPFGTATEAELIALAAAAESASEHPLATAILERARSVGIQILRTDKFEAIPGRGVAAVLRGEEILVGSPRLLEERGVDCAPAERFLETRRSRGETAVLVASGGRLVGALSVADQVKDDSRTAVRRLREMGLEVLMLSGDDEITARRVAAEVGIDRVRAGVLPGEKAEEIGRLQEQGLRVAMVGDGINDAPALTRADVGIAIGAGTDIAIESADVVLIHSRLSGVVSAFEVSRNSYRKTQQNLALAFLFNGVGVPLAATGLLHPVWAMGAMVASVSLVLLNSFGGRTSRAEGQRAVPGKVGKSVELSVPGMHCEGCARKISAALRRVAGVESVDTDLSARRVRVALGYAVAEETLVREIAAAGFKVE
ncbi:MAG: copper-translocating P-type ATPase [Gemmatimonadales bacterium]|nr:MAG: copper-translocating P-type ATPase [Gemmatimonadales bacterium]